MAFVREVISTEEDKQIYDGLGVSQYDAPSDKLTKSARLGLTPWVLDRGRNIFMCPLGGGACEMPNYYQLIFPEGKVWFEAYLNGKEIPEPKPNLHPNKSYMYFIDVISVAIEPQLRHRKTEVLQLIKETLAVEKGVDRPDGVLAVEVSFNPSITAEVINR